VKDGVEGGKPFDLLPKEVAEKHEREKNGIPNTNGEVVKENGTVPETSEDDLD